MHDEDPQPLFDYVIRQLAPLNLAYIHVIEGATGGPRRTLADRPFDYEALKAAYRKAGGKGAWMVNNGYDKSLAEEALKEGDDLAPAFRQALHLSTPDLDSAVCATATRAESVEPRTRSMAAAKSGYMSTYPALWSRPLVWHTQDGANAMLTRKPPSSDAFAKVSSAPSSLA